ncbi:aldehyde dehydrogenase [Penicillium canariense]|uniref:Aldehyde dehydrogenase n=1 Tax=Penicillium canariense TaxID=189055 RepID=A0A9W9I728_9EURO|nr:aldehyde dehydrogenase [Penicillium canariense]KAJ5169229.1 aldehyde dehydrogenase [Penicillium canariense]
MSKMRFWLLPNIPSLEAGVMPSTQPHSVSSVGLLLGNEQDLGNTILAGNGKDQSDMERGCLSIIKNISCTGLTRVGKLFMQHSADTQKKLGLDIRGTIYALSTMTYRLGDQLNIE